MSEVNDNPLYDAIGQKHRHTHARIFIDKKKRRLTGWAEADEEEEESGPE